MAIGDALPRRLSDRLGTVHGGYYLLSGLWPILSYRTFEWVTGPKRDAWLVKTVGLVTVSIGAVLIADPAGQSRQTRRLGVAAGLAYAMIDTWYAGVHGRIRPVYMLDAVAEAALVAAWLRGRRKRR